ncbi:MAG: endonuclease V [Planctomycetes bacterium HGW-Planctomycetes-1]|nr:MAG: endonuclease V [Planctomycetes bacterium HGW-Planctomycetes-1]
MKIKNLHNWNIDIKKTIELQKSLANRVIQCKFDKKIKTVAGVDCGFTPSTGSGRRKDKKSIVACIVVLCAEKFEIIETVYAVKKVGFPYVPGLLSFREAPVCIAAAEKLKITPDCIIVDGQGLAHPRRLGLACHLGLFLDIPTIGCAKSRLTGEFKTPARTKGSTSPLKDKGEIIGSVVRTRSGVKPVFVSVGNKCRLSDAVRIVLDCCVKYRLPEPSRLAHQTVTKLKDSKEI